MCRKDSDKRWCTVHWLEFQMDILYIYIYIHTFCISMVVRASRRVWTMYKLFWWCSPILPRFHLHELPVLRELPLPCIEWINPCSKQNLFGRWVLLSLLFLLVFCASKLEEAMYLRILFGCVCWNSLYILTEVNNYVALTKSFLGEFSGSVLAGRPEGRDGIFLVEYLNTYWWVSPNCIP